MKIYIQTIFLAIISSFLFSVNLSSATEKVGIDEHLGSQVPTDIKFLNSNGDTVILRELLNKPTLLYFVYFHCGGICNPLQNAVADGIGKLKMTPGTDYNIVTVCFDYGATLTDAKKWKENSLQTMQKQIDPKAWNVLIGDSTTIRRLTDAVGFYFKSDGQRDFIHAGSIFTLSTSGTICRYLYFDKYYNPFDLKMAILEASQNQSNPTIKTVLQFCFTYDPKGKQYVFNTTKVIGSAMLLSTAGLFLFLLYSGKKKRNL